MFGQHTLNPHYFANPPAYTYVLHYLFAIAYGSMVGVQHAIAAHPADIYTLARAAAAVLGTLALWLLYGTGRAVVRARRAGLLAAAIEAVAFLPVFYSHLALNDVPTLAPLTLSLLGTAGVLRKGRARDHLLAGIGPRTGLRDQVHGRDRARATTWRRSRRATWMSQRSWDRRAAGRRGARRESRSPGRRR